MGFLTPMVTDECDALTTFAVQQIDQVRVTLLGLTDEELRATPSASAMSLGALARHVAQVVDGVTLSIRVAPERAEGSDLADIEGLDEDARRAAMGAGNITPDAIQPGDTAESLAALLEARAQAVRSTFATMDLDEKVPVPDAPWYPQDLTHFTVRFLALHLIEENARHAGHADIIRESIDGKGAYELNALADGETWDPDAWETS